jgi:exopolysaccharide production protein ExoQ
VTALAAPRPAGLQVGWRTLECCGVVLALAIQSGAVIVLAFTDWGGNLTAQGRSVLQLLALPAYLVTLLLLARHPVQLLGALRRNIWFALLLALPFASVLWSIAPSATLRRAVGLLLSVLLAYLIALRFTPRQLLVLVVALLGATMVLSLIFAAALPGWAYMPDEPNLRGVFNHKNVLGWHAAVAVLTSGALATDRSAGLRRLGIAVLAASLACLLMSRSSTSLVMALCSGLLAGFFWALARSSGAGRVVLILLGVQGAGLVLFAGDILVGALLEGTDKDASFTGRVPLWALVDEMISRRLLLGYGYGAFWTEGNGDAWTIWTRIDWMAPHAHNGFRDSMLNFGLVGTLVLLVVILRAIRGGALLHCRNPGEGWLWLNVLICVYVFMNLTESTLMTQNSLLFILFSAAVLMISLRARDL